MSDAEWQVIQPLMPSPAWLQGRGGRPEEYCRREIIDAIRYVADNGCKWRNLPADFPPWRTTHRIFSRWWRDGDVLAIHNDLREHLRRAEGREPEPTAGVIDSQSVRAAETVGAASRGYDTGKKIQGRNRHILVDTLGLLLVVVVTAACVQDRDGAKPVLEIMRDWHETVPLVWADGGYAGRLVTWARQKLQLTLQVVKRSDTARGFVVLPRRWVVERTLSCMDLPAKTLRPRQRTPTSTPRSHGHLVHDHRDDPAAHPHPGHPRAIMMGFVHTH